MSGDFAVAILKIAELHEAMALPALNELGVWHYVIDDAWQFAINGTDEEQDVTPDEAMKATIPPYHAAVWYNGWVAGLMHPMGGTMMAGAGANEDAFIAVMDRTIEGLIQCN